MTNSDTGYGKPPKHSRFKPGVSGNPRGRPKRKPLPAAELINSVLNTKVEYRERGQIRTATRLELAIRTRMTQAVKGDTTAAEMLLVLRAHAQKFGDVGAYQIFVSDWLPDRPGQTAEEKTREFLAQSEAGPSGWQDPRDSYSIDPG